MDLPPSAAPIVEIAEQAPLDAQQRSYTRDDGTLVIDILADPPCGESSASEIVVCAPGEDSLRYEPASLPRREGFRPEVKLSENAKVSLAAQPGRDGAVGALVTVSIKF